MRCPSNSLILLHLIPLAPALSRNLEMIGPRFGLVMIACLLCVPAPGQGSNTPVGDPFGDPFGGTADPFGGDALPALAQPRSRAAAKSQRLATVEVRADETVSREADLRRKLDSIGGIQFHDLPLEDAARQLSRDFDIPILVDRRALEEIGLSADETVSLALNGVKLRSILRLMLRDLDLTYRIADEVLIITTLESAESSLLTQAYRLHESLAKPERLEQVVSALQNTVTPDTWDVLGGPSTMSVVGDVLVVATTEDVHADVLLVLRKIIAAKIVTP